MRVHFAAKYTFHVHSLAPFQHRGTWLLKIRSSGLECQLSAPSLNLSQMELFSDMIHSWTGIRSQNRDKNPDTRIHFSMQLCTVSRIHKVKQGQSRKYGSITLSVCHPHGANTSNLYTSLMAQYSRELFSEYENLGYL